MKQFINFTYDQLKNFSEEAFLKFVFKKEEYAALRDKRIELLNLFFENGDYGFYHTHLCDTHRDQAFFMQKTMTMKRH